MSVKISENRRELVAKILAENPNMTAKEAMIKAGFSMAYAQNSNLLTKTASFIELIEKYLPDKRISRLVSKRHKEGLNATYLKPHLVDRDEKGRPIYEYTEEPDFATRHKYIDSMYKLKGAYAPEKHDNRNLNINVSQLLDHLQNEDDTTYKPSADNSARPDTE